MSLYLHNEEKLPGAGHMKGGQYLLGLNHVRLARHTYHSELPPDLTEHHSVEG